jgi:Flp pilus assembly protein TadG
MSIRRVASQLKSRLGAFGTGIKRRNGAGRFLRSDKGAVAIYFGLSAIVFVGVAGLAVDAARGYLLKARLSEAIDAAALAGGKALPTGNKQQVEDITKAFFKANIPAGAMGATISEPAVVPNDDMTIVNVTATATIPTTLMKVLGFQTMNTVAFASVTRATNGLDVVFSFDVSGSMGDVPKGGGPTKISSLRTNAKLLVTTLAKPFSSGLQSQKVTIKGVEYSLLNIGVVPWNSKVNVLSYPATTPGATISGPSGGTFTNPMGGRRYGTPPTHSPTSGTLPGVFKVANSQVPLLLDPNDSVNVPGGWNGCVYARYWEDGLESTDADTTLGPTAAWPGWEPIPNQEGEPGYNGKTSGSTNKCNAGYWNDNGKDAKLNGGATKAVPSRGWWKSIPSEFQSSGECDECPKIGILKLQEDMTKVNDMIDSLKSDGGTDAPQGLFWAWEVLMPGLPFDEAKLSTPFPRVQAIVFMTDGQNWGTNGDAYHGWYGDDPDSSAKSLNKTGSVTIPAPINTTVANNMNNKLLQLATKIKGSNPAAAGAVKIYVIQYDSLDADLTALLKKVATNDTEYYFYASSDATLEAAFKKIASSLSALRLAQ